MDLRPGLLGLTAALTLAACTGHSARTVDTAPTGQASPATSAPSVPPSAAPSATAVPDATAPASAPVQPSSGAVSGAGTPGPTGPPRCTTALLALSVGASDSGAGTSHTPLVLRNTGPAACHLTGFPGVSFLDSSGRQVGPPARMTALPRTPVVLPPGGSASAVLAVANAGAYDPAQCRPAPAVRVRVYPPGDRSALTAPFAVDVCAGSALEQTRIDPLRSGSGTGGR